MRLKVLTSFILIAASLTGQEAAKSAQETPKPVQEVAKPVSPFQNLLDALGPDTTLPPYSVIRIPLKVAQPPREISLEQADNDAIRKEEKEIQTFIKGKISGGTQDGKRYEIQCIGSDCSFTLIEKNAAGQSTIERIGPHIFVFVDLQGRDVIDLKSLADKTDKPVIVQMTNIGAENQTIASVCFVGSRSILVRHGFEVQQETVEGVSKCQAMDQKDQLLPQTLTDMTDVIVELPKNWTVGGYTTRTAIEDRRPDKMAQNPETIQEAATNASKYLTERKSYLAKVAQFIGNKLHLPKPLLQVFSMQ